MDGNVTVLNVISLSDTDPISDLIPTVLIGFV